jgi:1-acyl-sn-glycerol-3-phosphate acyltransferase
MATGCPLVPIAQWGPQELLRPYDWRPRLFPRKTMRVSAGPPVELRDLAEVPLTPELLAVATERVMAAITAQLEGIRGARAPAVRFDPKAAGVRRTGRPHDVPDQSRHGSAEGEGE